MTQKISGQESLGGELDETITRCAYGDGKHGLHVLRVEGQGGLVVCTIHKNKLAEQHKDVRCEHCGVPIKEKHWKRAAMDGFKHVPNCPRSDEVVMEIG